MRSPLKLLGKAAHACGCAFAAREVSSRAAALLGKPSRVAARGALAGAVVHGSALGRARVNFGDVSEQRACKREAYTLIY